MYYRGAAAAVLCYDITAKSSFDKVVDWVEGKKKIIYICIQIIYIFLFVGLFFFAKYKGIFSYLLYRIFLFFIILLNIIIIKLYYYFICLPFFEDYIKDFFKKHKFINNICLFILK